MDPRAHGTAAPRTREEVAKEEIGRTDVTPAVARWLGVMFIAFLLGVPAFELSRAAATDPAARAPWTRLAAVPSEAAARHGVLETNRAVIRGLHEFEESLEDESRLGRWLRPGAQLLLSGVLGAGNEQAYIGTGGWLFYRADVEYVTGPGFLREAVLARRVRTAQEWTTPPQPDPRRAILHLHEQLAARGVALIVMPVPVKPTIHPEMLARSAASTAPDNPDYQQFVTELRRTGVTVFDGAAALRPPAGASGATQYLATDTHWRPEAMELVAEQLAAEIRHRVSLAEVPDPGYRVEAADVANRGDIFGMLDLPGGQALFAPETATVRRVLLADGSPWRPSTSADVLVLGDSFANIYSLESMGWGTGAGLVEHLSYALRRPVDRMVQNAAGAYATREMLVRAGRERLAPKRLVVYQFAVRELAFGDWKLLTIGDR